MSHKLTELVQENDEPHCFYGRIIFIYFTVNASHHTQQARVNLCIYLVKSSPLQHQINDKRYRFLIAEDNKFRPTITVEPIAQMMTALLAV